MGYLIVFFLLQILSIHGYDNLSLGQYSVQSSIWPCPPDCTRYSPNNAVDGNNKTCMRADIIGESSGEKTVWWRVNLGDIKSIYSIRIQFKNIWQQYIVRQRGRLAGFSLYIFNTTEIQSGHLCYKDGPELPLLDITNVCTNHGRYVIFYNERKIWEVYYPKDYETSVVTELCEVDVMGCHTEGFYGQNCDLACPLHCQKRRCHIINGTCLGCTAGWIGDFCNTACSFGYHGMECKTRCTGYCLRGSSCNHVSGLCEYGCESGWTAPSCDQPCQDGWYGSNCTHKCSDNCRNNSRCDKASGECESCVPGYIGTFCSSSCNMGSYGENCRETCSSFCIVGLHCSNTNGHCEDGCVDGYIEPKCDKSCEGGWYGKNCSKQCNDNCVNESCDHRDGVCLFGCKPGWISAYCTQACNEGLYGKNCSNICHHCLNNLCDPKNGTCIQGCNDGYMGHKCDESCNIGRYGKNCANLCNKYCKNKSCNNTDGRCTNGCEAGWMGLNCLDECLSGLYGEDCIQNCGKCALNQTCNRTNGACLTGCAEPFTGVKCDKNTETVLKITPRNFSECDFFHGFVIALSVGFAVSMVINIYACVMKLRRRYCKRNEEASKHNAVLNHGMAEKTEDTHTYQELNTINCDFNTYHNLSFGTSA